MGFERLLKYGLVTWKDFATIGVKFPHLRMKNLGTELAMTYLILAMPLFIAEMPYKKPLVNHETA